MRAIVVGGGIHGQVVTWRLAAAGASVTQIEAVSAGNLGSGSGDRSRIIRALYGEERFVDAGARSLDLWRAWEAELGTSLAAWLGVLYLVRTQATAGDEAFGRYVEAGARHVAERGLPLEELSMMEVARRFPAVRTEGLARAVIEPGAGAGFSRKATRTIARAAQDTGRVTFVTGTVTDLVTRGDRVSGVHARTGDGDGDAGAASETFDADVVILAAGLGGVPLVRGLTGKALPVRRIPHFVAYFDVPHPEGALLTAPALIPFAELGSGLYGFPDDGEAGFKVAWHEPLRADDAQSPNDGARDTTRDAPSDAQIEALRAAAAERFPGLARARCRATYTCAYDATPDENFLVGWVPETKGLYFVGGMSGHGYKHAPAIGVAVAAEIIGANGAGANDDARATLDLSPYALRFVPE